MTEQEDGENTAEMSDDREPHIIKVEVGKATNELKDNEAPGPDWTPAEMLESTGEEGMNVGNTRTWPDD